jgi:imidazolonepropionase
MNLNIIHAGQLVTVRGPAAARRGDQLRDLGIIPDGAVAIRDGLIDWVGPTDQLPDKNAPEFDARGQVVLPGFVDSHTHAVFARTRADEFEWRIQGTPYMEILKRGGGILSSVKAVREAASLHLQMAERFLEYGTTTIEAKSGYGLNLETEVRMLEAMRDESKLEVVPTYLGAHALPLEFANDRVAFVESVSRDLETISERKLAEFCDVFVEPGVFTPEEARRIFSKALSLGLNIKVHADEFQSFGGTRLAVEVGATSADHLGAISDDDIQRIAVSDVIATLLPATLFMLGATRYAPARQLIERGAAVALATDFNPGTSPTLNMQFILTLACTQMKMTPAETIVAATFNGACALRRQNRIGSIERGKQADIAVFDVSDYREIPYFAALNCCVAAFKRGTDFAGKQVLDYAIADADDPMNRAIRLLPNRRRLRHQERLLTIAFLIRRREWRPLEADWWRGKEVCIIGADADGNFFLRHPDGSVRFWEHHSQTETVIANSIKAFLAAIGD